MGRRGRKPGVGSHCTNANISFTGESSVPSSLSPEAKVPIVHYEVGTNDPSQSSPGCVRSNRTANEAASTDRRQVVTGQLEEEVKRLMRLESPLAPAHSRMQSTQAPDDRGEMTDRRLTSRVC
jgi:hypothetical protein